VQLKPVNDTSNRHASKTPANEEKEGSVCLCVFTRHIASFPGHIELIGCFTEELQEFIPIK